MYNCVAPAKVMGSWNTRLGHALRWQVILRAGVKSDKGAGPNGKVRGHKQTIVLLKGAH